MKIDFHSQDDITIVTLSGELNGRTVPDVQAQLMPYIQPGCKIVLDLRHVTYMSSAGLRFMLLIHRQTTNQGGRVVITSLSEWVEDTMSITGFLDFFEVYDSLEAGVEAVRQN